MKRERVSSNHREDLCDLSDFLLNEVGSGDHRNVAGESRLSLMSFFQVSLCVQRVRIGNFVCHGSPLSAGD